MNPENSHSPPEEFYKIINDFVNDIKITFPEYTAIIDKWWHVGEYLEIEDVELRELKVNHEKNKRTKLVFSHCLKVFPERFFDILYQNSEIYDVNSNTNTQFLPGIVFSQIWNSDISDKTKDTIWKYLQLIVLAVIGNVNNASQLGDTAKLFELINQDELKNKLKETMEGMYKLFEEKNGDVECEEGENDSNSSSSTPNFSLPDAEELHNHINGLMGGKLGKLAMELAEETANDLNLDMENVTDTKDVFQQLFKNPTKLMNIVKSVGNKLDSKIKSGEIKESEIMEEGIELLNKMKNVPGMKNMEQLFSKLGMPMPPNLGKDSKINVGAMKSKLSKNLQIAKMKEKLKTKSENIQVEKEKEKEKEKNDITSQIQSIQKKLMSDDQLINMFNEEKGKTNTGSSNSNKKKKNKK